MDNMMVSEIKKNKIKSCFKGLTFTEKTHKYSVNKEALYTSVSGIIKNYVKETDFTIISHYIDKKEGLPKGSTKQRWDNKSTLSCMVGTKAHYFGELYAFYRDILPTDKYEEAVKSFWDELPEHIVPVFTELQMYHLTNMFGGTADIILYNLKTDKFIVADYKSNAELFKNFKGKKLLPPFDNMLENSFNKYQLQFSLYQILFEQTGFEVESRILVWLKSDGTYETFEVEDLTKELIKDLENAN